METQFSELANAALEEIRTVFRRTAPDAADRFAREIFAAPTRSTVTLSAARR